MTTSLIHLTERTDSTPDERYFDGWVHGCTNVVSKPQMFAMTSHQAIAWKTTCERELFKFGLDTGKPVETRIVHDNF